MIPLFDTGLILLQEIFHFIETALGSFKSGFKLTAAKNTSSITARQ
jgi:hypothetical protein